MHKVRREYISHFANDEIATKKFFDAYVLTLPLGLRQQCPSYFDLRDKEVEIGENNTIEKERRKEIDEGDDNDERSIKNGSFASNFDYGENGCGSTYDSADEAQKETGTFDFNFDDGFIKS